jgi:hypothetical protein
MSMIFGLTKMEPRDWSEELCNLDSALALECSNKAATST